MTLEEIDQLLEGFFEYKSRNTFDPDELVESSDQWAAWEHADREIEFINKNFK